MSVLGLVICKFFSYSISLEVIPGLIKFKGKKTVWLSSDIFCVCFLSALKLFGICKLLPLYKLWSKKIRDYHSYDTGIFYFSLPDSKC